MVASVYAARLKKIQITNEREEKEIEGSGPHWFQDSGGLGRGVMRHGKGER